MSNLEQFKHMWDGSEPDWELNFFERIVWTVSFEFSQKGPTLKEILALKQLVPEYKNINTQGLYKTLKSKFHLQLESEFGNIESRRLAEEAEKLSLNVKLSSIDKSSYLPVKESVACLIENEELSQQVTQKMLSAGVPVNLHHVD